MDRVSETQLQVGGNSNGIIWRLKVKIIQFERFYIDGNTISAFGAANRGSNSSVNIIKET